MASTPETQGAEVVQPVDPLALASEIERLLPTRNIFGVFHLIQENEGMILSALRSNAASEVRVAALEAALRTYGQHARLCAVNINRYSGLCNCGLRAALGADNAD